MGVQRSVCNERIKPPEQGPTRSRERATCSKSPALVSVAILRGGHWGRRSGAHSASFLFPRFVPRGTWGRLGETWGSRPSCLVAGASLLFPRTPARITTFRCVERSRYARLSERKKQEEKEGEGVSRSWHGWVWRPGELSHALPLQSSSISLILCGFTDARTYGQAWTRRHLCSRNRIRLVPPTSAHEMAMDSAFKAQVVNIFGADSKFEAWLVKGQHLDC